METGQNSWKKTLGRGVIYALLGAAAVSGMVKLSNTARQNVQANARTNIPLQSDLEERTLHLIPEKLNSSEGIDIVIPEASYLTRKNEARGALSQFNLSKYTKETALGPLYDWISENGHKYFNATNLNDIERVQKFMTANFKYQEDGENPYAKYPLETLVEGGGDCEDLTAFAASALSHMGRKVLFAYEPEHVCLGVELKEGETPYTSYTIPHSKQLDELFARVAKENPNMTMGEMNKIMIQDDSLPKERHEAATIEHEGKTYQFIECTSKNAFFPKTKVDITKIVPYLDKN